MKIMMIVIIIWIVCGALCKVIERVFLSEPNEGERVERGERADERGAPN